MKKYLFSLLGIAFALAGCVKDPGYSSVPTIDFVSIKKYPILLNQNKVDSIAITLFFRDGDGDLGINPTENKSDSLLLKTYYNANKQHYYNYVIRAFRKKNGAFQDITASSGVQESGRFPRLRTDGQKDPIDGYLYHFIDVYASFVPKNDSIRYEIQIKDRAFNISNKVVTDVIVLNQQ
jgi:hypothetical protein